MKLFKFITHYALIPDSNLPSW